MLGLKNLFRGKSVASDLPADIQQALSDWRASPDAKLGEAHYHTRYVVIDVKTSGFNLDQDHLLGISAIALTQGGCILPGDVISLDFYDQATEPVTVNRQLVAFLQFTAKAPLVCYHWPFVSAFLQRVYKENLGLDFPPDAIDLAWLLPSLFEDKAQTVQPLDHWLEAFGMDADGRRDSMTNALVLARLMQRVLVRATDKEIDTAGKLIEESIAALTLRRSF